MKAITTISLLISTFFFAGCPEKINEPDSILTISNESNIPVAIYDILLEPDDTLLNNIPHPLRLENLDVLPPDTTVNIKAPFIKVLKESPDKNLMVYFFSVDTIKSIPWERVRDEYLVLRRYEITLDDFLNSSHSIVYE